MPIWFRKFLEIFDWARAGRLGLKRIYAVVNKIGALFVMTMVCS
jgi:hypothetical protein